MKKILFVCYGMGIGGIEKCLVNLINSLDRSKYNIFLALMNPEYEMLDQISNEYALIDFDTYFLNTTDSLRYIKNKKGISKLEWLIRYIIFRVCVKFKISPWKLMKSIPETFDIAVSYSQNGYTPYYVMDKVKADKKILWYHDLMYYRTGRYIKYDLKAYSKCDNVIAVSQPCADTIKELFNLADEKVRVIHNVFDREAVIEKSEEYKVTFSDGKINLLTVARMTPEKGFSLAVEACKYLKEKNIAFNWYWVGDGSCKNQFENLITENDLNDYFVLLGNQSNPYPYFKACDIYVQPSFSEAYSTTIIEAKILCKPIVSTRVRSIFEQVKDGENALVSDINGIELGKKIEYLIKNNELSNRMCSNLMKENEDFYSVLKDYDDLFLGNN